MAGSRAAPDPVLAPDSTNGARIRVVSSPSSGARLDAARRFLESIQPRPGLVLGASRGAADDLARDVGRKAGATFGLFRFSVIQFAARAAASAPAPPQEEGLVPARGESPAPPPRGPRVDPRATDPSGPRPIDTPTRRAPASQAGSEAMAARAVFDAVAAGELAHFEPVASMPGFPRAVVRTLNELRLAAVSADRLECTGQAGAELGRLLARVEAQFAQAAVDDRAALFRLAAAACRAGSVPWTDLPMVLLDIPLESHVEREFLAALVARAPSVLATVPDGDRAAFETLVALGAVIDECQDPAPPSSDLMHLRRYVFTADPPAPRDRAGDVRLFSAPGEGREAVEIVRRILDEAARGVRFDEMAVFLRAPQAYIGLLEHACARGGVPAYFDRGTRRPDPAGRAFIALLSCAIEGLSARRFDEYLSLGQVPQIATRARSRDPVLPRDEVFHVPPLPWEEPLQDDPEADVREDGPLPVDSDEEAVVAGTLRSPWKWEALIVESAIVGGRTRAESRARWRRRLDGLAADYRYRLDALERDEPESPRIDRYRRDLRNLRHLRTFALPIIDELADWPERARWGEWVDRFSALASRALRRPVRVLQTLADLRPMAAVGPISVEEARDVLHDRLVRLDWDPPPRRYGRLFVGTPEQARGRSFRVVFVPGLAERVVPQRPREDPLLLDADRRSLDPHLIGQPERANAERLLLKLSIGAAAERLYLSYPRLDIAETRARVPSFYALDVVRAMTGRVPDHRVLAAEAAEEAGASLAWPAPRDPGRAIDDLEHDLAVLKPLIESRDPDAVKGHAHYLLQLNAALRRSVVSRWARGRPVWSTSDGLIRSVPAIQRALESQRLRARPYSLSALQRFASCPYQFLLATIHRLQPWDEPEPLLRMDPLTRGSLFHRAQAEFYRTMQARGALPVSRERLADAARTLDEVLDRVAAEYAEQLVPAIDRVWRDEIADLRRDLGIWVQKLADDGPWLPEYFEFSFGLSDEGRDPRSLPDPVVLDGRFVLRGSVDLIERSADGGALRVTDHKTGRNRSNPDLIIGGGSVLQPVLYSVAVEQGLGKPVAAGRLFYCTTVGGFVEHQIPMNDYARGQGLQALAIIDRAVEQGFLAAAPAERACSWCDFRPVCGPREEERVSGKRSDRLADLQALRSMR